MSSANLIAFVGLLWLSIFPHAAESMEVTSQESTTSDKSRQLSSILPGLTNLWQDASVRSVDVLETSQRIVGGRTADEYPSFGFSAGSDLCGGVLIHEDIFLTAAHCTDVFLDGVQIGGTDLFGRESTYHPTALEFPHPAYNDNGFESNDIMLVKLGTPSTAPLAQVNFDPNVPPVGTEVTNIGYGHTSEGGEPSTVLLEVESNTVSFSTCNAYYGTINADTQICQWATGRDTCQGDSGGTTTVLNVR